MVIFIKISVQTFGRCSVKKDRFLNAGVDLSGFEHGKIEEMIRKNGMLKENQAGRIKGSLG